MKLNLPTIVDNHNDVPGVVNALAQVPGGNASVIAAAPAKAASVANNAPHDGNDAPLAINQATTNNAPKMPPTMLPMMLPKMLLLPPTMVQLLWHATMFLFLGMLLLLLLTMSQLSQPLPILSWPLMWMLFLL